MEETDGDSQELSNDEIYEQLRSHSWQWLRTLLAEVAPDADQQPFVRFVDDQVASFVKQLDQTNICKRYIEEAREKVNKAKDLIKHYRHLREAHEDLKAQSTEREAAFAQSMQEKGRQHATDMEEKENEHVSKMAALASLHNKEIMAYKLQIKYEHAAHRKAIEDLQKIADGKQPIAQGQEQEEYKPRPRTMWKPTPLEGSRRTPLTPTPGHVTRDEYTPKQLSGFERQRESSRAHRIDQTLKRQRLQNNRDPDEKENVCSTCGRKAS
ncbi:hypothetical protein CF326_g6597 [Tilletia indica]|nr:hypothetical protein CF326_g6597 [Tilletia indica]